MSATDDVLRYAFSQGPGRDFVAPLGPPERPLTTSFGNLPGGVASDRMCPLVWGTVDLLEDTAYPRSAPRGDPLLASGAGRALRVEERIQHALVMAFGLQRREPSNLFNDHRSCASVRSRFPVHTFVHTDNEAWFLDVYRHGLLPVGDSCPRWPEDQPVNVALVGRYTHLPSLYGRLRGPLVELELGISLRALFVALEVVGLAGELHLPGPAAGHLMSRLALDPPEEWSLPLTVAVQEELPARGAAERAWAPPSTGGEDRAAGSSHHDHDDNDDPMLAEVVAVNRTSLAVACPPESRRGTAPALPAGIPERARSWSEVLWHRNAGRMPRGLAGVSGRRRPVAAAVVNDAVAWVAAAPPTALLQEIAGRITVSACLQDAEGFATGWYRLQPGPDPRLELVRADPSLPARLEGCYGQGLNPNVGCAVRQAAMVWVLSTDVTSLLEDIGPGAWTLAQYVCGWMAHGLCLAAAAHGLYARPSRAFDEILLHPIVGMAPNEIVLLSVVSGAGRFVEPLLDLRT